ncbi:hypothetical protein J4Q44_G00073040 [Coregonus suidteri]|uniref:peptidylprolyl isomerase n=1 Tax=Coregonus suidteri TaxID=861788 RepID=A0AAN8MAD4_9TELE
MRKGEFSCFLFLPEYAYGAMGCPPHIPPVATVLYEVQVLDFLDSAQVDEFFSMSVVEHNTVPLSMLLNVVDTERRFGNHCFNQSRFEDAKDRYKQAEGEDEKRSIVAVQLPIYLNLSLTQVRLDRHLKAMEYGHKALEINPNNTKALFHCGQAYLELFDYEKAQDYITMAQANKAFDIDINNLLRKLAIRYKDCLDKEKEMCSKMFADFVKK